MTPLVKSHNSLLANIVAKEVTLSSQLTSSNNNHWQSLIAAWLGLMFDGMDATICILVLFPALSELLKTTSHATVGEYGGIILATFMFGWAVGAVVFGILADHIGRTKVMVLTILLYALCSGLCAISHSWGELAFYRFLVGCGIGGEHITGVILIAESWKGKGRLHATGMMTTAFGAGYMLAALLNIFLGHLGWRSLFLAGVIPALLTVYIRSKLTEPSQFQLAQENKIELVHSFKQVFNRENLPKILVLSALYSASTIGYWAVMSWIPPWINQLTGTLAITERSTASLVMNFGSIIGGAIAGTVVILLGRRNSMRLTYIGALLAFICMFMTVKSFGPTLVVWAGIVGFFAHLSFPCIFIYGPELFDTHIRGAALGFSIQIGRLAGALAALIGGQLIAFFGGSYAIAASCMALFYLVGIVATFFMPTTSGEVVPHPESSLLPSEEPATVTSQ